MKAWWGRRSGRAKAVIIGTVVILGLAAVGGGSRDPGGLAGPSQSPRTAQATATPTATPTSTATTSPSPSAIPSGEPTAEPTPEPAPPTEPPPEFLTFGDGTLEVGTDIAAGTYRLREPADFCYWARLKGFGGTLAEIIANDNVSSAYAVVTIAKSDAGFESNGCGEWTNDLSQIQPDRQSIIVDGTYIVGTDILPGKRRSSGGDFCYWSRLSGFSGQLKDIIANDNVLGGGTIVTVGSSDAGFHATGCGTWTRG